ncbi:immune inhibitor A domain-containing protein [Archangium sp.]|jgi:immune inhibitor A|uniref:immune inhibitor A domain-containing protein n=1 Tax=Archangium sp. TaxID=1872627 RepID=UPI002EDBB3CD
MRRITPWLASVLALAANTAVAEEAVYEQLEGDVVEQPAREAHGDDIPHPLGEQQRALREKALQEKLAGKATGKVHEVAKGQFVELELARTDKVFVVLAEFGNTVTTNYGGQPGPLHNKIAAPNRAVDNSTIWQPDYSREHYERLYFSTEPGFDSVANYYRAASSGRYTISGTVTEWVKVPYNEARYGTNACGSTNCSTVWYLVADAINIWTANQLAAGKTPAEVKAYLDSFDIWDRYDYDADGNFDEPDGYIDHFQIVHAGVGEETGGGAQGTNAIWSHRWFAFSNKTAPSGKGPAYNQRGGTRFGAVDKWVGDYTIQPENGGLGVFAHEYGHDLGLPDQYDTTNRADNATGFWTIMSSGSYLNDGTVDIGSRPGDFFAWDKLKLGWLNYDVAQAGQRSSHRLGPAETNTKAAQALLVKLPPKERKQFIAAPFAGARAWHGGIAENLDSSLVRTVTLPAAASIKLDLKAWFNIEKDWDYAYVSVSADGTTFTNLPSSITTAANPNSQNFGNGITGASAGWVPASFDLSAYAGKTVQLRLRYWTDGFVTNPGILFDELAIVADGATVFSDGAEAGANGWSVNRFLNSDGNFSTFHEHFYLAEYRQHRGYDTTLETGPYNFSYSADGLPDYVEHYAYNPGMLITYVDTSVKENNVFNHPGEGRSLVVDARPTPLLRGDGRPWAARVQIHDATFGLEPSLPLSLKFNGAPRSEYPSQPAVPAFDDTKPHWFANAPYAGVKVPATGTAIEVVSTSAQDGFMQVLVRPAK